MSDVIHIAIFGRRNSGKSSLINTLIGQEIAIVSDTPGTTTDPVRKRIEIPEIGPVTFIDTAGIDDKGELGKKRVRKSIDTIRQLDFALLLITNNQTSREEIQVIDEFAKATLPYIIVHSQSDIIPLEKDFGSDLSKKYGVPVIEFSSAHIDDNLLKNDIEKLVTSIADSIRKNKKETSVSLFEGLITQGDTVLLVCPIDSEAPKGRLIVPQITAIRDILDRGGIAVTLQPEALPDYIKKHSSSIDIVVTDSQVFDYVNSIVPENIPLTSFSILLARSKGRFSDYLKGTRLIDSLKDGDKILILESCTHHSTCDDIGRVKIPKLLTKYTGKEFDFVFVSGLEQLPEDIISFSLAIQCGGCMVTDRQLANRIDKIIDLGLDVTNYGMAIAFCNKIFDRTTLFLKTV